MTGFLEYVRKHKEYEIKEDLKTIRTDCMAWKKDVKKRLREAGTWPETPKK